jgi:vacuolar-type H+-ATPase subunit I/STV1
MWWPFPVLSVLLLIVSISLSITNKKERKYVTPLIFLILNGVLLISFSLFLIYLVQDDVNIITAIPAIVYWLLIVFGIIFGLLSASDNNVPGYITSAAILLFTGFIAMFSIGIVLVVLAIIELLIAFSQYKKWKRIA